MTLESQRVVVFDLDDTLYKERDYLLSGVNAVLETIRSTYGDQYLAKLSLPLDVTKDWLSSICAELNLPATVKESLLWTYRLHEPSIRLSESVRSVLKLIGSNHQLAILTDGRAITQRQKLKSLGLGHLPAYISEEYGDTKPDTLRYEAVMHDFPAKQYFYIGDNPAKDFIAPNQLGWTSVGLKGDDRNIHSQILSGMKPDQLPSMWIEKLNELVNVVV